MVDDRSSPSFHVVVVGDVDVVEDVDVLEEVVVERVM